MFKFLMQMFVLLIVLHLFGIHINFYRDDNNTVDMSGVKKAASQALYSIPNKITYPSESDRTSNTYSEDPSKGPVDKKDYDQITK